MLTSAVRLQDTKATAGEDQGEHCCRAGQGALRDGALRASRLLATPHLTPAQGPLRASGPLPTPPTQPLLPSTGIL